MIQQFVPNDFIIPEKLETKTFILRMLSVDDLEKDYEAVMCSRNHIINLYGDLDDEPWPDENMTIEEDLADLQRHQNEFLERKKFAYTLMSIDESLCLGAVYIEKSEKKDFDAEIYLWARESEVKNGLQDLLYKEVKKWINEKWPFKNVAYPCIEIEVSEWKVLS